MKARELQQQTFDAEQKKYQLGASTVYTVIQTQRDLTIAQGNEIRALANLEEAKAGYERAVGRTLEVNHVTIADGKSGEVERETLIPGTLHGKVVGTDELFKSLSDGGQAVISRDEAGERVATFSGLAFFSLLTSAPRLRPVPLPRFSLSHSMELRVLLSFASERAVIGERQTMSDKVKGTTTTITTGDAPAAPREPSTQERAWEENTLRPTLEKSPERQSEFTTISGYPIRRLYTPADLPDWDPNRDLGFPGEPPYTRGIHSTMHRGRLWTMRQFAGFGTAEDTNQRFRYLLAQGQTGLSTAFDLPTLMGYDSDHPLSEGEVGKCGVAISSLADMEVLFDKIPLANVTTSMTINSPAAVIWAMYLAVAEKQGADWKKLSGTLQNDILKEYIAQKEYIYPPEPSMRLVIDTFEFGVKNTPKFNPISISGYHIREAGSTAIQELAFTLRDGIEYVEYGMRRGLDVDRIRPAALLLFQRAQRFLRRNRQVPRRSPHLAQSHGRTLRREESAHLGAALPHADRGLLARPRSSRTTTWSAPRSRRWPPFWAARNRCTPIRSTKPGRCRPSSPPRSRCARSKSSRTKPASPTRSIRSAARISSKR